MAESPRDSASHAVVYAVYDLQTSSIPSDFSLPADIDSLIAKKVPVHSFDKEIEVCRVLLYNLTSCSAI